MSSGMLENRMTPRTLEARNTEKLDQVADTVARMALQDFAKRLAGRELPVIPEMSMKPYSSAASFQSPANLRARGAK